MEEADDECDGNWVVGSLNLLSTHTKIHDRYGQVKFQSGYQIKRDSAERIGGMERLTDSVGRTEVRRLWKVWPCRPTRKASQKRKDRPEKTQFAVADAAGCCDSSPFWH